MADTEKARASLWTWLRSSWSGPLSAKSPELARLWGAAPVSAGVSVNEQTALTYSAVYAAVSLISGDVASLPLALFKRNGAVSEPFTSHQLYRVLHDTPNPEMSSVAFRRALMAHALTWGGGFAEIERDGMGRVKYLWPITPDRVSIARDRVTNALIYRVTNPGEPDTSLAPENIVHIHGLGWDGVSGYSVVAKARESIGLGVAQDRFAGTFFGNGASFGGVFEHPAKMSEQARKNFVESINSRHQGVERAHRFIVTEEGMKYQRLGIPPEDAQFLESRQFQVTEIARWFNLPPHKIGDLSRATFSNVEQQAQDYLQTTLLHWLKTWEQELMLKLIAPQERNQQVIEHNVDGLLRGDSQGRAALQSAQFNIGGVMPNEIRRHENRNPVPGGDRVFVPLNMMPLDRVDEYVDAQIESLKKKPEPPQAPPEPQPDPEDRAALEALTKTVEASMLASLAARTDVESLRESLTATEVAKRVAEQRAEDLSGALEQSQGALTETDATLVQVREHLDGATVALAEEKREREIEREMWTRRLEVEVEGRAADATAAAEQVVTIRAEADAARVADRDAVIAEARLQVADVEARAAQVVADAATSVAEADARVAAATEQVAIERRAAEAAIAATAAADAEKAAAVADALEQVTDAAATVERVSSEAAAEVATARAALAAAEAASAAAEAARLEAVAVRDAIRVEMTRAAAVHQATLVAVSAAQRAMAVEVVGRLVRREIEKARRAQATPAKLRSWVPSFYEMHRETCREMLRPVVAGHVALCGAGDVDAVTDALVREHVTTSERQLLAVADGDPDDFHGDLSALLLRWETHRPQVLADGLLVKELTHVR